MTRHHKFLGSNAKPVEAGVVDPSVVQSTINPSVEENTMTTENTKATNEEIIDVEVSAEEATKGLKELAKKKSAGFRKGSVAYAGILSGAISAIAMLAARSSNEDVKLSNADILKRTAVNTVAAATVQTAIQAVSKRVNDHHAASYVSAHVVGCITAPVGMRTMISKGFGADGYVAAGTTEAEFIAAQEADLEFTAESAPAENVL